MSTESSPTERQPIRVVMVLPGAASLGAYQAGAAAAVIEGVAALDAQGTDIAIPAVGGASAGATVSMLSARVLSGGLNAVSVLHAAWVDRVDFDTLTRGEGGPLGLDGLREGLEAVIHEAPEHRVDGRPRLPVAVHVALTSLRGFEYPLENLGSHTTSAITYADWAPVSIPADAPASAFLDGEPSFLDLVLSSTANPVAFPPVAVRAGDRAEDYRERGWIDPPEAGDSWWYTDGGLVQSEPIQRTLDCVPDHTGLVSCLLIDPRSEAPSTGNRWADADRSPDWLGGLMRALSIFPAQALSDELRRIDEVNLIRRSMAELAELMEPTDRDRLDAWLDERQVSDRADPILAALLKGAGIDRAFDIHADVISPRSVLDGESIDRLLAGELMGDFAGFLSRDLRSSDFSLGFEAARMWWQSAADEFDIDDRAMSALVDHLDSVGPPPWSEIDRGDAELSDVPLRSRAALAKVVGRAVKAAASD